MNGHRRSRKSREAGLIISDWLTFKENYLNWMAGSGIAYDTVFGPDRCREKKREETEKPYQAWYKSP